MQFSTPILTLALSALATAQTTQDCPAGGCPTAAGQRCSPDIAAKSFCIGNSVFICQPGRLITVFVKDCPAGVTCLQGKVAEGSGRLC